MWPKLREYAELGAMDSEGIRFVEFFLNKHSETITESTRLHNSEPTVAVTSCLLH